MMYKLTAKFMFHNQKNLSVTWIERDLFKQGKENGQVTEVPLTNEEVEMHFRKVFLDFMSKKELMSIPTVSGYVEIIPFDQVFRMSFKVSNHSETEEGAYVQSL